MTLRFETRHALILAVGAALSIGVFISPGVRHSHPGGDEPHSHGHPHAHTHLHHHGDHGHRHHHHGHHESQRVDENSQIQPDRSHIHVSIFGFEFTIFDASEPATSARRSAQASLPEPHQHHSPASLTDSPAAPSAVVEIQEHLVPERLAVSAVNSLAGDWSDWAKYNVAQCPGRLTSDNDHRFSRPCSEALPRQGSLKPPLPPPRLLGTSYCALSAAG